MVELFTKNDSNYYFYILSLTLGDVTTVNLTFMSGGVQMNVVPNEFTVGFDIRITPTTPLDKFEAMLNQWIKDAGSDIEVKYEQKFMDQTLTSIAEKDPWYQAFMKGAKKHDLEIVPRIFPAGTDSRYIREVGIPAFGFSPMNNTPGKVNILQKYFLLMTKQRQFVRTPTPTNLKIIFEISGRKYTGYPDADCKQ